MHPSQIEWATFYGFVFQNTGLDLNQYKANQMQRRILTMVDTKGFRNLTEFWNWIGSDKLNITWFLDRMAINVSEMFRNPAKWEELKSQVIPDLLKRTKNLKCWSAGCSYGAEAYSLAMVLESEFPGAHTILGTDIDDAALNQANAGEFSESDVRGVPRQYREKFVQPNGLTWQADPKLKSYLKFKKHNILADRFERGYDLILCRNVVIYFTEEAKEQLYRRFFDALSPGGILLVGGTERIFGSEAIGFGSPYPFFYNKPLLGEKQWRNAS